MDAKVDDAGGASSTYAEVGDARAHAAALLMGQGVALARGGHAVEAARLLRAARELLEGADERRR